MPNADHIIILTAGNPANPVRATVGLFGNQFTAALAREAAIKAFGHTNGVSATCLGITYKLYPNSTRKVKSY